MNNRLSIAIRIGVNFEANQHSKQNFHGTPVCRPVFAFQNAYLTAISGFSINSRISSARHTVVRGPSLIGLGNRPSLTPAHHVLLLTGIIAGIGGSDLGLPMIWGSLTKPDSGR
jgi:hypothetical protein